VDGGYGHPKAAHEMAVSRAFYISVEQSESGFVEITADGGTTSVRFGENDSLTWGMASEIVLRVPCTAVPTAAGDAVLRAVLGVVLSAVLSAVRLAARPVTFAVVCLAAPASVLRIPL